MHYEISPQLPHYYLYVNTSIIRVYIRTAQDLELIGGNDRYSALITTPNPFEPRPLFKSHDY